MNRLRVASLQYFVRPIQSLEEFEDQVRGLVRTAADYDCELLVFPEYFTVQLLTLGDVERPMADQVRGLADRAPAFREFFAKLARDHSIHIAAGTIPERQARDPEILANVCHVFGPDGTFVSQAKLHMTPFEKSAWNVRSVPGLKVFDTAFGRMAVTICYDVEFPEVARAAAQQGATILVVPSYTDDRQGFLRVRYCAQARAIENQMFVIHSATVGSLPMVPAVSLNYGQASILTPSDFPFARDGILAEGIPNQEMMVIGELNLSVLRGSRRSGTVVPLRDSRSTAAAIATPELLPLSGTSTPLTRRGRSIVVRPMETSDFPGVKQLAALIYPDITPWSDEQLASHLTTFPQGQLVAEDTKTGKIVGTCAGLVIAWDEYEAGQSWATFTADGTFANHDPVAGRTLFAADVMVQPGMQGRGIGKLLYKHGRFDLARQLGLERVLAGARLRGYHRFSKSMSAQEYVEQVVNGELNDPTLSFQLAQGFGVVAVVGDYFDGDPESEGWAAVIEWRCKPPRRKSEKSGK